MLNTKVKLSLLATILTSSVLASPAHAQFAKAEDAIEYRQASLSLIGTHFKRVGAVAKGEKPYDKASMEQDIRVLETLAHLPWDAFTPGSTGSTTHAKPEIWSDKDKFKAAADKFEAEMQKLAVAARSGDQAQLKTAYGATGQSCKGCHESFRSK